MTGRKRICMVAAVVLFVCLVGMTGCDSHKKVMDFSKEEIGSMELILYDSVNESTTSAWCYKEEDMEEVLSYLSSLEGKRISELPVERWPEQFWGVRLNGYHTVYKLLIVGDYAITADGKYYEIDGGKANEVYGSMPAIDKYKWEGLTGILNVRYIAERNGSYDTAFMQKVTPQVRKAVPEAVMKTAQDSYSGEDTEITFTIENCGDTDLEYGSQVSMEVLIDGDWYDMNNMLTENVDIGWTDELRIQQPETVVEDTFYIKYYQPLCKGTYRLVKEFAVNGEKGYAACEFEIE